MAKLTSKEKILKLREAESLLIELMDELEFKLQRVELGLTKLGEMPDRESDVEKGK